MARWPTAGGTESDPVAGPAVATETTARQSADTALDARLDALEVGGQAVPVFVSTAAPTSPPASYLWVKLDGTGAVDDLIAVGV